MLLLFICNSLLINCKKEISTSINNETGPDSSYVNNTEEIPIRANAQLLLYDIEMYDRDDLVDTFISVSDIYMDPLSVPPEIIENQKQIPFEKLRYINLDNTYRTKMLKALHLTESDTLYIFNYSSGVVEKTPLKNLKSVAYLSYYVSEGEEVDNTSYMLGFQVNSEKKVEEEFYNKYDNAVAYFGSDNPFIEKQMVRIKWKKIKAAEYTNKIFNNSELQKSNIYEFKNFGLTYYLQDYGSKENVILRVLIVVDKDKNIFFEKAFDLNGEGRAFNSLSGIETDNGIFSQWTGKLFKNKPPVIFGFTYESFGCSSITIMDQNKSEIVINCDNRH